MILDFSMACVATNTAGDSGHTVESWPSGLENLKAEDTATFTCVVCLPCILVDSRAQLKRKERCGSTNACGG